MSSTFTLYHYFEFEFRDRKMPKIKSNSVSKLENNEKDTKKPIHQNMWSDLMIAYQKLR